METESDNFKPGLDRHKGVEGNRTGEQQQALHARRMRVFRLIIAMDILDKQSLLGKRGMVD